MKNISLVNGEFISEISVYDRGLNYGDGFFETMKWSIDNKGQGKVEFWKRHVKRLKFGCQKILISFSLKKLYDYKKKILKKACESGRKSGILKIIITRGSGGRGYRLVPKLEPSIILLVYPDVRIDENFYNEGVNLTYCKKRMSSNHFLGGTKNLNRLDSVLAASEFDENLFFEGIVCNNLGEIIEGTKTNIFFLKNNILHTPNINDVGIKGIIRDVIVEKKKINFFSEIVECKIKKNDIEQAESIFITNSIYKILPVKSLNRKLFVINEKIKKLIVKFSKTDFLELG